MSDKYVVDKLPRLEDFGNVVPKGYEYYEKLITPAEDLSLPTTYLKWYNLRPANLEISHEQIIECRTFLEIEMQRLKFDHELGFVILHRAGSALLLLVTTWRNTNEMWESVYVKDLTQASNYVPLAFDTSHRGTYCVWELGIVWHERNAWVRFIASKRDEEAKRAYVNDRFSGRV